MEEQYKQITAIITRLAAENPYITKEQIAKAKSMYNGDQRPIEEIQRELVEYSEQILAQGRKAEEDKKLSAYAQAGNSEEKKTEEPRELTTEERVNVPMGIMGFSRRESAESTPEPVVVYQETPEALQRMVDEAFEMTTEESAHENDDAKESSRRENEKIYVKEKRQPTSDGTPTSDEAGYGNAIALLTLTIMFSIVTIVIAAFTILVN